MMAKRGVDAIVATSAANITYFSGYSCWLDPLLKEYMLSPGASSSPNSRMQSSPLTESRL
jgi:hypothetical protein